ncbi:MAG TPA: hypothetical protein VES20_23935, partial [Bryobacteraceae bacterium]|nr:hypothetical protein [Bryobacteraceae bacterium]
VSYGAAVIRQDTNRKLDAARYGDQAGYDQRNPWTLVAKNADAIRGKLRIRMVCGELDGADRPGGGLFALNTEFKDTLRKLNIPVEQVPVPGVAHDTGGLYARVGLESLNFIQAGRAKAAPSSTLLDIDLTKGEPELALLRTRGGAWKEGRRVTGDTDRIFIDLGRDITSGYVEVAVTREGHLSFEQKKRNWFGLSASPSMNQSPGGYARAGGEGYGF